ncbi:MAG: hypothetical protein QW705_01785 [Zestosphaera sp.]
MACTKAQIILLLEKIAEEMRDESDRMVVMDYVERIRKQAWAETLREIF